MFRHVANMSLVSPHFQANVARCRRHRPAKIAGKCRDILLRDRRVSAGALSPLGSRCLAYVCYTFRDRETCTFINYGFMNIY